MAVFIGLKWKPQLFFVRMWTRSLKNAIYFPDLEGRLEGNHNRHSGFAGETGCDCEMGCLFFWIGVNFPFLLFPGLILKGEVMLFS